LDAVILLLVTFVFLVTVYPFFYIIILSLNDGVDALRGGIYLWPRAFSLNNYQQFLSDAKWINAIWVSAAKTAAGTGLTVLFTSMVAYGLSAPGLMGKKLYNIILLVCMYFSGGLIPYYLTLRAYGMLNTFWVLIIPTMFSTYYCILAVSFFREMPVELNESARLDGAGELTIFLRIILPLSKALLATLALFAAVSQWNSWSDVAFFAPTNKALKTLASLMREIIIRSQVDVSSRQAMMQSARHSKVTASSVQMAAMIIAVLPIVMVYPFLQRYFVKGIMLGAVKG
ncbi:MAG: carbohydrate ABC transporter permease, partial [Oscillospiraceae bacterium]|jgi:putative aldouronate transport system permease protein|nr:carbohydrate ABC transporter permease [Oscillospiraceae bacterium]